MKRARLIIFAVAVLAALGAGLYFGFLRAGPTPPVEPVAPTAAVEPPPSEAPASAPSEEVIESKTLVTEETIRASRKRSRYIHDPKLPGGTLRGVCFVKHGKAVPLYPPFPIEPEGELAIRDAREGEQAYYEARQPLPRVYLGRHAAGEKRYGVKGAVIMLRDVEAGRAGAFDRLRILVDYRTQQIVPTKPEGREVFNPSGYGIGVLRVKELVSVQNLGLYDGHLVLRRLSDGETVWERPMKGYEDPNFPGEHIGSNPSMARPPVYQMPRIETAGVYELTCRRHPWQRAHLVFWPNPYLTVSRGDPDNRHRYPERAGEFAIAGIPEGEHTVEVWHPELEPVEKLHKVRISMDEVTPLSVEFKPPAALEAKPRPRPQEPVTEWAAIGPFYPLMDEEPDAPNKRLDFAAVYDGMVAPVRWRRVKVDDKRDRGYVRVDRAVGSIPTLSLNYFAVRIDSPRPQKLALQMHVEADDLKVWLNRKAIFRSYTGDFGHHHGRLGDWFIVTGDLKAGENTLLMMLTAEKTEHGRFAVKYLADGVEVKVPEGVPAGAAPDVAAGKRPRKRKKAPPGTLRKRPARPRRAGEEDLVLDESTHWRLYATRGPMRLDGKVLRNEAERERHDITRGYVRSMRVSTQRLLQGQNIDWEKKDWRDHAVYCPDVIGNPYYPRMMSLVRQEYPPEDWVGPDFDDGPWMTVWNTRVRGQEGKGSVYNRNLYMRTYFDVPDASKVKELLLEMTYRGGARVFVNGTEVARGHLPKGKLSEETPGQTYAAEAYCNKRKESADRKTVVAIGEIWTRFIKGGRSRDPRLKRYRCPAPANWNGHKGPWLNREGWNRLLNLRDRRLAGVRIPGKLLKKGRNMLAVELRGSLHHPLVFAPGKWGHGKAKHWNAGKSWDHVRLVDLKLRDPSGTVPSAMRPPEQLAVWVEDMHTRLYDGEYRPTTMPTGELTFVGALNGHFGGQLSLMSGGAIKGLKVAAGDLKIEGGKAVIAAGQIDLAGMVGEPLTAMTQLGVHIKGLGREPLNFMARQALSHTLHSPFLDKPLFPDKDWIAAAAGKVGFYDHIGGAVPETVPANTIQPIWVRLRVPMKTPPGTYKGRITVTADGAEPIHVPVRAEIIDWRVPSPEEFVFDMGLEHHPYAIANHYLLPEDSPVRPRGRDWEGPVKARVPLWSDEHFRLLINSFKQMARAGNDLLFIPVLHRTEFGNYQDSMIKWIRRKDGSYDFDFSILDRYLDLAVEHMGRPRVVCFVIMHCQLASPTPSVTVHDEASGKKEVLRLGWKQDAFARLPIWKEFGSAVLEFMADKGLAQSVYWGHGGDHESDPALMGLFWEVFPNTYWCASGHTYHGGAGGGGHSRNVVRYFADVYGAASPVESKKGWKGAYIGGGPSVEIGTQYAASSRGKATRLVRNETYLYVHIPRDELRGAAQPIRWRGIPSISLHRGYCGLGHIGFDGYHHIYLDGYIGSDWAFPGRPHHMMSWPGPDGAQPSARYEALLEGIQEGEARIFLEQTVDRGLLSDKEAAEVEDVLLDYLNHYCLWPQLRSDSVYDHVHGWQADSRKLFATAARVARKVGIDIAQLNLRAKVAALGEAHRTLLLRNWTGQPRAWTARSDQPWLKLKETEGRLLGFKPLAYYIDGKGLKPAQTVKGNIVVTDVETGREQTFALIADVIDPLELRYDHPNFNLRCGKSETRRFRLVNNAVMDLDWKLSTKQPWLKIAPAAGKIPAGKDAFITLAAAPPDKTAATHDNGLVFSGAKGLLDSQIDSKTFVIPLLREKEDRRMPYGKIIKLEDVGKVWTFHGTCLKGTKIETGAVKEIGKSHTKALQNPSEGPPCARKEFLPIIGNERFSRAMWVYPHHESVFKLEGSRIQAFSAYVGVSNDARQRLIRNQHRMVNFEVWVDGKVVTQSGLMKTNSAARYLTVEDLNGAKELKLVTRLDSNRDDNTFLSCWCDVNFYAEPVDRSKDRTAKK